MTSGAQVATIEERSATRGARAKYFRFAHAGAWVGCGDLEILHFCGGLPYEFSGRSRVAPANENSLKTPDQGKNGKMRASEAARAKDAEGRNVRGSKKLCGEGGSCGGAEVCKVIGLDGEAGLRGFGIEKQIGGLNGSIAAGKDLIGTARSFKILSVDGLLSNQHQFHSESGGKRVVAGHGEKGAMRQLSLSALRNDHGGIAIAEG